MSSDISIIVLGNHDPRNMDVRCKAAFAHGQAESTYFCTGFGSTAVTEQGYSSEAQYMQTRLEAMGAENIILDEASKNTLQSILAVLDAELPGELFATSYPGHLKRVQYITQKVNQAVGTELSIQPIVVPGTKKDALYEQAAMLKCRWDLRKGIPLIQEEDTPRYKKIAEKIMRKF